MGDRVLRVAAERHLWPLTPERKLPLMADAVRQRWKAIASAGESDEAAAEQALLAFYEASGVKAPERILWCDSPWELVGLGAEYTDGAHPHPSGRLWAREQHEISRDWALAEPATPDGGGIHPPLREKSAWSSIWTWVGRDLEHKWPRFVHLLWSWETNLGHCWEEPLPPDFLQAAYVFELAESTGRFAPSPYTEAAIALTRETAGWWIAGRSTALLCRRPLIFECNQIGQLHSETGPAVRWRDGVEIYVLRGERYPAAAIETPSDLTIEAVLAEREFGVRRELISRYPVERFMAESMSSGELHVTDRSNYGELLTMATPPKGWQHPMRLYLPSQSARARQPKLADVHVETALWNTSKQMFHYLNGELSTRAGRLLSSVPGLRRLRRGARPR